MLQAQAALIKADIEELRRMLHESGEDVPPNLQRLPLVNKSWVTSWRKEFRISWRTRTICYKVARHILLRRLGVLFRNVIRIRYLHQKFYGKGKHGRGRLRQRSYDQKPEYFNAVGGSQTLACVGDVEIDIRENHHATRSRFSLMTKAVDIQPGESLEEVCARSSGSGDPRRLAVCFKAQSGEHIRARWGEEIPSDTLLQFAPKGSYRVEHIVEFLEWDLGAADSEADCEIVWLDYYAPHRDVAVRSCIKNKGHVPMDFPGGSTPWTAPLDTHAHWPLERGYREAESLDASLQLRRGYSVPCSSKQTVFNRARSSWHQVDHRWVGTRSYVANGLANALDESEDVLLSKKVVPFWAELQMPAVRRQLIREIDDAVESGQIVRFQQYEQLMEQYDDHDALMEGEEQAKVHVYDDTKDACDSASDTPNEVDENADEGDALQYEEPDMVECQGEEAATVEDSCADLPAQARVQIQGENDRVQLTELEKMIAMAKAMKDTKTANFLEWRLREVAAHLARPSEEFSALLRQKALERREVDARARADRILAVAFNAHGWSRVGVFKIAMDFLIPLFFLCLYL